MSDLTDVQVRELRDALNAISADATRKHKIVVLPAGLPAMPREFTGEVIIEWPAARSGTVAGRLLRIIDATDGGPIETVTGMTVHASALGPIWAELTMFADADGRPLLSGEPVMVAAPGLDGTEEKIPRTGTFPFLVAEMRVASGE